jgi:hypothetical protein
MSHIDLRKFAKDLTYDVIVKTAHHVLKEGSLTKNTIDVKSKANRNKHSVFLPNSAKKAD